MDYGIIRATRLCGSCLYEVKDAKIFLFFKMLNLEP